MMSSYFLFVLFTFVEGEGDLGIKDGERGERRGL